MKVTAINKKYDYREGFTLEIDGKEVFSAYDGEPEDSNLSRDFNDIYIIPDLMERAYKAGKNGESFEQESIEGEW